MVLRITSLKRKSISAVDEKVWARPAEAVVSKNFPNHFCRFYRLCRTTKVIITDFLLWTTRASSLWCRRKIKLKLLDEFLFADMNTTISWNSFEHLSCVTHPRNLPSVRCAFSFLPLDSNHIGESGLCVYNNYYCYNWRVFLSSGYTVGGKILCRS